MMTKRVLHWTYPYKSTLSVLICTKKRGPYYSLDRESRITQNPVCDEQISDEEVEHGCRSQSAPPEKLDLLIKAQDPVVAYECWERHVNGHRMLLDGTDKGVLTERGVAA